MIDWIELIRPYTKHIVIDKQKRGILLIHPHFQKGKTGYKELIKALINNQYHNYNVQATGFASVRGLVIIRAIMKHLEKQQVISSFKLIHSLPSPLYTVTTKLK